MTQPETCACTCRLCSTRHDQNGNLKLSIMPGLQGVVRVCDLAPTPATSVAGIQFANVFFDVLLFTIALYMCVQLRFLTQDNQVEVVIFLT